LLETYKCVEKDYNQAYKLMYWAQCALDVEQDEEKVAELEEAYKYNYDVVYDLESKMKDIQECYVGDVDFRIFKKDYCKGFANGLEHQLEQSLIEMNLHPKYELAVVGVPTVVKEWANKKIKVTKSKSRYVTNEEAYKLGNQHGLEYKVKRTDLLES
jgi:hypothetical protein